MSDSQKRLAPEQGSKWGWYNRINRVPHYQRLFQKHDGLRQWQKTPKSRFMIPAFNGLLWFTTAGTMYMMFRMVLGHKTWWGEG